MGRGAPLEVIIYQFKKNCKQRTVASALRNLAIAINRVYLAASLDSRKTTASARLILGGRSGSSAKTRTSLAASGHTSAGKARIIWGGRAGHYVILSRVSAANGVERSCLSLLPARYVRLRSSGKRPLLAPLSMTHSKLLLTAKQIRLRRHDTAQRESFRAAPENFLSINYVIAVNK